MSRSVDGGTVMPINYSSLEPDELLRFVEYGKPGACHAASENARRCAPIPTTRRFDELDPSDA